MLKVCKKCKEDKPLSEYIRQSHLKDGHHSLCNTCRISRRKELCCIIEVTEKVCKDCGELKPISAFNKANISRDGHQTRCYECYKSRYGSDQLEKKRKRYRTSEGWILNTLRTAKKRAKKEEIPFNLLPEDIELPDVCPVLGIPLEINNKGMSNNSPTLDKIVPSLGYVKGNVRVISWLANRIKGDQTDPTIFEKVAAYLRESTA